MLSTTFDCSFLPWISSKQKIGFLSFVFSRTFLADHLCVCVCVPVAVHF